MWNQSLLTSAGQVEALRLLSEWWDSSRRAAGGAVADVLVLPPGCRPAHLDERPAKVG